MENKKTETEDRAAWEEHIKKELRDICPKCRGKGYSTEFKGIYGSPDFIGDRGFYEDPEIHINYCDCERGKQLEALIKRVREERILKGERRRIIFTLKEEIRQEEWGNRMKDKYIEEMVKKGRSEILKTTYASYMAVHIFEDILRYLLRIGIMKFPAHYEAEIRNEERAEILEKIEKEFVAYQLNHTHNHGNLIISGFLLDLNKLLKETK